MSSYCVKQHRADGMTELSFRMDDVGSLASARELVEARLEGAFLEEAKWDKKISKACQTFEVGGWRYVLLKE